MRYGIIFILLLPLVHSAELSGNLYDYSLEPLNNVILTVDTQPRQQYISRDGTYSFELAPGDYTLRATLSENKQLIYSAEESINISDSGHYVFDIIMFPSVDTDEVLTDDLYIDLSDIAERKDHTLQYLIGGLIFLVLAIVIWFMKREPKVSTDETYDLVLEIIRKHRRISQKEIRKALPVSEAKISLVITELEDKGIVQKVKKGRGNVIILK